MLQLQPMLQPQPQVGNTSTWMCNISD